MTSQIPPASDHPSLTPWTVMIKYLKTGRMFFVTEIECDTEEEAIAEVLSFYTLPRDAFELTAKRVPVLLKEVIQHAAPDKTQSNASQKVASSSGIRATATRK